MKLKGFSDFEISGYAKQFGTTTIYIDKTYYEDSTLTGWTAQAIRYAAVDSTTKYKIIYMLDKNGWIKYDSLDENQLMNHEYLSLDNLKSDLDKYTMKTNHGVLMTMNISL